MNGHGMILDDLRQPLSRSMARIDIWSALLLNHADADITGTYDRSPRFAEKLKVLTWWVMVSRA